MDKTITLTIKEMKLLKAIAAGMDEAGSGWLHELAPETHETAGVLGSLIKKGLVESSVEPGGIGVDEASWVNLTDAGEKEATEIWPLWKEEVFETAEELAIEAEISAHEDAVDRENHSRAVSAYEGGLGL